LPSVIDQHSKVTNDDELLSQERAKRVIFGEDKPCTKPSNRKMLSNIEPDSITSTGIAMNAQDDILSLTKNPQGMSIY